MSHEASLDQLEECTCYLDKPDNKEADTFAYLGPQAAQVDFLRGNNQLKLTCKFNQLSKIQLSSQDH